MTFVTSVEGDGRTLLKKWYAKGAQIIASSIASREIAESVVGKPLPNPARPGDRLVNWTWSPIGTPSAVSGAASRLMRAALLLTALLLPMQSRAANLKGETVAAWDSYVQSVDATLHERVRPGGPFLWVRDDAKRIAKVHGGEIVVAPAPGPSPRKVPGGLIHHWIGAAFLPDRKLDDILNVTREYDRYKEVYQPSVVESKTTVRGEEVDRFSMVLMNQAFFLTMAVDADYQVTSVRLDEGRYYSVSRSMRVQEIENYRRPGERRMPEGEGAGLIWKLFSTLRLSERDGGVYVEMEAVALSRDIPGALHFFVDPIVRRVSRNSILTSISQTGEAARRNVVSQTTPADSTSHAEQIGSASATLKNKTSAFARVQ